MRLCFMFVVLLSTVIPQMLFASEKEGAVNIQARVNGFSGSSGYQSLLQLEGNVPHDAKTAEEPWSGNYWPLFQGQIAYAYGDGRPLRQKKFELYYALYKKRMKRIEVLLAKNQLKADDIDKMAPSEKYDLYLGDTQFTLTKAVWASLVEANSGRDRQHQIKDWEGICHGWAAASAYSKRPIKKIMIPSLGGKFQIPFYPDDLKALSTLLWANSLIQDQTMVEGYYCRDKPTRDYGTGKIMTTRCKGVNPGVFHLTMLALVGQKHVPFIINKNNDKEIWNQPVHRYHFTYYNVKTGQEAPLRMAALPLAVADDRFKPFRPSGTSMLVGVDMIITYSSEVDPTHQERDSTDHDEMEKMHVRYDLELDSNYNVLGGEWIAADTPHKAGSLYPGFMWRFKFEAPVASSIVESKVPEPESHDFNSVRLLALQKKAAQFQYTRFLINDSGETDRPELDENGNPVLSHRELRPQPLGKVVNYLVELSRKEPPRVEPPVDEPTDDPTGSETPDTPPSTEREEPRRAPPVTPNYRSVIRPGSRIRAWP